MFISGCQIYTSNKPPLSPPNLSGEAPKDHEKIRKLLEAADLAIQKDQLLYPEEDNAYTHLSSVIDLETDNIKARRGFEKIIERYIQLSISAIGRKQFNRAQSMLDRARLVDKEHPSIQPAQKQLDLVSSSTVDILKIGNTKFDAELEQKIGSFGLVKPKKNCRFLISAPNDKQGRLIYQKLKSHQNNIKLNAQIEIKLPMQIERQCFNH